jgi:L-rhamnose isomerase
VSPASALAGTRTVTWTIRLADHPGLETTVTSNINFGECAEPSQLTAQSVYMGMSAGTETSITIDAVHISPSDLTGFTISTQNMYVNSCSSCIVASDSTQYSSTFGTYSLSGDGTQYTLVID